MYQIYPTRRVDADIEFLAHEKGLLQINHMISGEGIEPDADGKKYVKKGSFIDKDGKVVTPTWTESGVTFSNPPIGILFATVNCTYGDAHGSLMVAGTVKGEWLLACSQATQKYNEQIGEKIVEALPGINVLSDNGSFVSAKGGSGSSSSSASTTVDLSKATGTLAVKNGGTGATSAEAALEALGGQKKLTDPLPIANGGTGATSAEEALTNLGAQKA